MKPFAVIDCETPPFLFERDQKGLEPLKPFLWGYFNGIEYHQFEQTADLVAFISQRDEVIYAHNGGKFDFHFLTEYLEPFRPIKLINGRIAKVRLGQCELRDSYNIIPAPLADFQKTEIDYQLFEIEHRYRPEVWAEICAYQKDDCVQLYHLVSAFIEKHGMVLTQASAAMKYFKKIYEIDEIKTEPAYFDHFEQFYYGGRVQCFQRGIIEKPFSVYDINSAYPYAMLENHTFGTKITRVNKGIEYAITNPQAFFDLTCISDGVLPWREKVGKKLIFPTDKIPRRYRVTGWEIRTALKHGALSDVELHAVYNNVEMIDFQDYVNPIYQARLEAKERGDKAETLLLKLLMNSLYGKFGANPNEYAESYLFSPEYADKLNTKTGLKWAKDQESIYADDPSYFYAGELGAVLVGERDLFDYEKHFYNVATAASITGYVRAYLFDAIMTCGRENVLYCDTDSLVTTNGAGLKGGKELGAWKWEGDFYKAAIAGRKIYALFGDGEPKTASKGAILTAEQIERLALGESVTHQKDAPSFSIRFGQRYISRKLVATF